MIRGHVSDDLQSMVAVRVENASGEIRTVRALIDTGFDGWLSLPMDVIDELDLPWRGFGVAELADDQEITFSIFAGYVVWDGAMREVTIDSGGATPLVGMGLLENYELRIVARTGGDVSMTPIA